MDLLKKGAAGKEEEEVVEVEDAPSFKYVCKMAPSNFHKTHQTENAVPVISKSRIAEIFPR